MSEDKTIKTAIKNMNVYLDECHDDNDTITMTAKVLRSIRDNYCELLRYKVAVEGMNAIIQQNNSKLDLQADYKTLYEDLKAEHIETVKAIKQAKSEAVREFSVAVQDAFAEYFKIDDIPVCYVIDKILGVEEAKIKELVGDDK